MFCVDILYTVCTLVDSLRLHSKNGFRVLTHPARLLRIPQDPVFFNCTNTCISYKHAREDNNDVPPAVFRPGPTRGLTILTHFSADRTAISNKYAQDYKYDFTVFYRKRAKRCPSLGVESELIWQKSGRMYPMWSIPPV